MDAELRVERAWARAQGLERLPEQPIHADDDMFRPDVLQPGPDRRRLLYARSGFEARTVLEHVLAHARPGAGRLGEVASLLDFAGGYGRVLRHLLLEVPRERLWHSDILPPAVEFVRRELGVSAFLSARDPAEIRFPRRFSVIWVASLFSHLSRPDFGRFMRALHAVLEEDGVLIFSTHCADLLPAERRDPGGFTFVNESESRILSKTDYGTSYVEPSVVREICAEVGIEHLWCQERELWRIQDVFVAAKRDFPGLARWTHAPLTFGSIEKATVDARGHAWIGGWVRVPAEYGAVGEVSLLVDGQRAVPALFARAPGTLPPSQGGERFAQTDWYVEGPASDLERGAHTLAAVVRAGGGLRSCFDACVLHVP